MKIVRTHAIDLMRRPTGATPKVRAAIEVQQRPEEPDHSRDETEENDEDADDPGPSLESTTEELSVDVDLGDVKNPATRPSRVSDVYDELEGDELDRTLDVVF